MAGEARLGESRLGTPRTGKGGRQLEKRMKQFAFRNGSRISGVDAQVVGAELEKVRALHGALVPQSVVDEARPEESPLHPAFEWDDSVAAENHRQWQARNLIRAVCVKSADGANLDPVYVHVRVDDGGSYQHVEVVAKDPDMLAAAIEELNDKLQMARRSVDQLRRAVNESRAKINTSKMNAVGKHLDAASKAASGIV
jgi:hypothetical protein